MMAAGSSVLTKEDLQELLRSQLDEEGAQIEDVSITRLTKPGDNAGSTMLAVDVSLSRSLRILHLVAKMLPISPKQREYFQCEMTVRKETDLYQLVQPAYKRIQKENNVPIDKYLDVFAVCYGARISYKGDSAPVDEGSVILLENLKVQGYETGERFNGLNLAHCKLVIEKLARFHATAVAIKIKKPKLFKETVLRAAANVVVGPDDLKFVKPLEAIPEYESMKERITTALLKSKDKYVNSSPDPPREPYATITHQDLWVNNIMFHYGSETSKENPVTLKFVDFQITRYDSPARDLLFFLYSSASLEVLSEHYDFLVKLYYDNFVDCLQVLGCETEPFTFEEFQKELQYASTIELWHIIFMIVAISAPLEEISRTDEAKLDIRHMDFKVGKTFPSRASKLILDFASKTWI